MDTCALHPPRSTPAGLPDARDARPLARAAAREQIRVGLTMRQMTQRCGTVHTAGNADLSAGGTDTEPAMSDCARRWRRAHTGNPAPEKRAAVSALCQYRTPTSVNAMLPQICSPTPFLVQLRIPSLSTSLMFERIMPSRPYNIHLMVESRQREGWNARKLMGMTRHCQLTSGNYRDTIPLFSRLSRNKTGHFAPGK